MITIEEVRDWVLKDQKGNTLVLVQVAIGEYKLFKWEDGKVDFNRFSDETFRLSDLLPHWLEVTDKRLGYWEPSYADDTIEAQITRVADALDEKRSDIADILHSIVDGTWDGDISAIESRYPKVTLEVEYDTLTTLFNVVKVKEDYTDD